MDRSGAPGLDAVVGHFRSAITDLAACSGSAATLPKWLAFFAMIVDHVGKTVLLEWEPIMSAVGRLALPMFAVILAANIAAAEARGDSKAWTRAVGRLLFYGLIAQPIYAALFAGDRFCLNILLTFACGILLSRCGPWRYGLILGLGPLFEAAWFGLLIVSDGILLFHAIRARRPIHEHSTMFILGFAGICYINHNLWALLSIPLILVTLLPNTRVPRMKLFFYAFYPVHLAFLLWISRNA